MQTNGGLTRIDLYDTIYLTQQSERVNCETVTTFLIKICMI